MPENIQRMNGDIDPDNTRHPDLPAARSVPFPSLLQHYSLSSLPRD